MIVDIIKLRNSFLNNVLNIDLMFFFGDFEFDSDILLL